MKQLYKDKNKYNTLFFVVFIAVFGASIVGAQIFGVSLNKVCIIPLELYLIWNMISRKKIILTPAIYLLIAFYLIQIINSTFALFNNEYLSAYDDYSSTLTSNIIQNFIFYLPMAISIGAIENKPLLFSYLKKSIVYVARFQAIWAIIQFILWYAFTIDFNDIVFNDVFHGSLGANFQTMLINIGGKTQVRAIGFNHEPAATSLLMVLAVCFDKKFIARIIYCFVCVIGMSRVGMLTTVLVIIVDYFVGFISGRKFIKKSRLVKISGAFLIVLVIALILYFKVDFIKRQVDNAISRFINMSDNNDGSSRHMMYPIYAVYSWVEDLNFFEKLFGAGARVSGLVFVHSSYVSTVMSFNSGMLVTAWEIECDFAAILLGDGIFGMLTYILIILKLLKNQKKELSLLGIGLFVFGFMYAGFSNTLIQIVLLVSLNCVNVKSENKILRDRGLY